MAGCFPFPSPIRFLAVHAFEVKITREKDDIEAAQRLRFEVFNIEMKEGLQSSYDRGLDVDDFDPLCDHLIVRAAKGGPVIGTYRLLRGSEARSHFGFYSEREFDLAKIKKLKGELLELGRSCVHKDYRDQAVLDSMWQAIADYIRKNRVSYLFGCASLHTTDPGEVSQLFGLLKEKYFAAESLRVNPLPERLFQGLDERVKIGNRRKLFFQLPSLIKGYLRVGAVLCGPPALDREFGTTDFFLLLEVEQLSSEQRRRFGFSGPKVPRAVA